MAATEAVLTIAPRRALAIKGKTLGPDHPDTASTLNNMAVLREKQGDLAAAAALFDEVAPEERHKRLWRLLLEIRRRHYPAAD